VKIVLSQDRNVDFWRIFKESFSIFFVFACGLFFDIFFLACGLFFDFFLFLRVVYFSSGRTARVALGAHNERLTLKIYLQSFEETL